MENDLKMNTPQRFDVLIVDAFSSDAIPVHLLTRECFSVYWRHMKPDGLLLLHITNRFLDLEPVVRAQAAALGCRAELVRSPADPVNSIGKADWMILTNNEHFLHSDEIEKSLEPSPAPGTAPLLWTDDFASLWKVLKR
jgi:spermidine synthase